MSTPEGTSSLSTDAIVNDRTNLEQETFGVRLTAVVAFSLIIFVLFVVAIFFGFAATDERLFLLGIGHLFVAPIAAYASLRLGFFLNVALVAVVILFFLDVLQFAIRIFVRPITLITFFEIVVVVVFIAIDLAYLGTLYRLRVTDKAQNNPIVDSDPATVRENVIRQEANTLRLAAMFDFIAIVFWLFFILIFLGFSSSATATLALLSVGHIILAPYAAFVVTTGMGWAVAFIFLALTQAILDSVQLGLRFASIMQGQLGTLSFENIFLVAFLLINVTYIILDAVYVIAGYGYVVAVTGFSGPAVVPGPIFAKTEEGVAVVQSSTLGAYSLRQRKAK